MTTSLTPRLWSHRYALTATALALLAAALALSAALPPGQPPIGFVWMEGDSMGVSQPVLALYGPSTPSAGDFVIFQSDAGYIGHRLVERAGGGWITQGDAVPHTDQAGPGAIGPVSNEQIVAGVWLTARLETVMLGLKATATFSSSYLGMDMVYRLEPPTDAPPAAD